jgi:hypothetical protein
MGIQKNHPPNILLFFVMVRAKNFYPPSMEEGEEQYGGQESTIPFNPNYCKRVFFCFSGPKFLVFRFYSFSRSLQFYEPQGVFATSVWAGSTTGSARTSGR